MLDDNNKNVPVKTTKRKIITLNYFAFLRAKYPKALLLSRQSCSMSKEHRP